MAEDYNPNQDYAASYDALRKRIATSFAGQRAGLNQELATRGVSTSGVAAIPSSRLGAAQAGEEAGAAANFASQQAATKVQDRQAATEFERQKQLMSIQQGYQDALQRRMANNQLTGSLIGGAASLGGSLLMGPWGKAATVAAGAGKTAQ